MFLYLMYCLICLFIYFMNDFDRKMFDNDRQFQCNILNIRKYVNFGGGGG